MQQCLANRSEHAGADAVAAECAEHVARDDF